MTSVLVLYAGLAAALVALLVATAVNRWSLRVFFLLALRLAIGWHFLFEGLHKIHSHHVGPSETNRPFTSEPYFKVAQGPLGPYMRRQFEDPAAVIDAKVKAARDIRPEEFAKLSAKEQAEACPPAVAQELDALVGSAEEKVKADAEDARKAVDAAEQKALKDAKSDADKAKAKAYADKAREEIQKRADSYKEIAPTMVTAAKATYARWVYGVEGRPTKVKFITGDASLTAPQRLAHLDWLRRQVQDAEDRRAEGLGNGNGTEIKRAAEVRTELVTAESDLAKDANAFVAELKKGLGAKDEPSKADSGTAAESTGKLMDRVTMWVITLIGVCLLLGLFTPAACVAGAVFLAMTYLTHPPFPWYPLPPNTEGNPVFVNKNVIEAIALLAIAVHPTGRWLGLDALLCRLCRCGRRPKARAAAAAPAA